MVLQVTLWSILLIVALAGFFALAYRSYAQFLRQHRTLTEIYDLTRAHRRHAARRHAARRRCSAGSGRSCRPSTRRCGCPRRAAIPEVLLTARVDDHGSARRRADAREPAPAGLRRRARRSPSGRAEADEALRAELRARPASRTRSSVPLRAGSAVIGTLEVAGRLGDLQPLRPPATSGCSRRSPRTPRSRWRTRGWSTGCASTPYHDALTGLPNRRRITAALEESVSVRAPGEVVAVLLFDVDGLREVNESLGHAAGDKVLAEVARRLRALGARRPRWSAGSAATSSRSRCGSTTPRRRSRWPASCASRSATRWCSAR